MKTLALLGGLVAAACSAPITARTDVSYTQSTTTPFGAMMGSNGGAIQSQVAVKGRSMRTETTVMGSKTIIIVNGSAGSMTQLDPVAKIYVTGSPSQPAVSNAGMKNMGSSEVTVAVKKLAAENIRGTLAPHWRVDMTMRMSTPRGPQTMNLGMEIWSSATPYPGAGGNPGDFANRLPSNYRAMFGDKVKVNGDFKGMAGAFATIPLRTKIFMNNQQFGTAETTAISTNAVPDSLFAIPAGYHAVTREVWNQKQRTAMMSHMGGMFKHR